MYIMDSRVGRVCHGIYIYTYIYIYIYTGRIYIYIMNYDVYSGDSIMTNR